MFARTFMKTFYVLTLGSHITIFLSRYQIVLFSTYATAQNNYAQTLLTPRRPSVNPQKCSCTEEIRLDEAVRKTFRTCGISWTWKTRANSIIYCKIRSLEVVTLLTRFSYDCSSNILVTLLKSPDFECIVECKLPM